MYGQLFKKSTSSSHSKSGVDPVVIKKIEDGYKTLQAHPECKSLLKKHLTKDVVEALKDKQAIS